jgi:hypothetical protein
MEWNRMNIQQELEELKSRIAEIEKAVKEKAVKGTAEKAKGIQLNTGEYVVLSDGVIQKIPRNYPNKDVNNCWLTEQQAEEARNIMSAIFELKQLCDIINEGWKPDFDDDDESKYYLGYDHVNNAFYMCSNSFTSFHSFYFKRNCLDEILPVMSDNLKAYIKGQL